MNGAWQNKLYFGDNLEILRDHVGEESVDLIYLDPPFNSKATYSVLFKEKNGTASAAQVAAFEDTWHWDLSTQAAYQEVVTGGGPSTGSGRAPSGTSGGAKIGALLDALRQFLGSNDMMAYLVMMAIRLIELHRVLKPTGSIYLHCDPTASHYLKLVMDAVFGGQNFQNEIIWRYSWGIHTDKRWNRKHDTILMYSKSDRIIFNALEVMDKREDEVIRRLATGVPSATMAADKSKHADKTLKLPSDAWSIPTINAMSRERMGYPTQKPEALLERIIKGSSNEGDVVLDPFCGCGTTIAVAERLHRHWIGIDITHLAITLMKNRLEDAFGAELSPYEVIGEPQDVQSARALAAENRYQFEWWALGLVEARPAQDKRKGADRGVDGEIVFFDDDSGKAKKIIVQVKSGQVTVSQMRDLKGVMEREKAEMAAFITLEEPTGPMKKEAATAGFYEPPGLLPAVARVQILTIAELLAGRKLAYPRIDVATFKKAPRRRKEKKAK